MNYRTSARATIAVALILSAATAAEAGRRHASKAARDATTKSPQECLARAMYFESNRLSQDGMLAVGTVVANRLEAGRYGATMCEVVRRKAQFAPGVLTRTMSEKAPAALARRVADAVLAGERHPVAGDALYFHTASVPFRHDDKRYVLIAGGNAFYGWNRSGERADNVASLKRAVASADADRAATMAIVASLDHSPEEMRQILSPSAWSGSGATVAAATPKPAGPRVITPTAPVLASMLPFLPRTSVWAPKPKTEPSIIVAQAWAPFQNQ